MFTKFCAHCGKPFETNRNTRKYCSIFCKSKANRKMTLDCYYKKKLATQNRHSKKGDVPLHSVIPKSLDPIDNEIREYNEKHGTNYSYGWYTYLKDSGKLK